MYFMLNGVVSPEIYLIGGMSNNSVSTFNFADNGWAAQNTSYFVPRLDLAVAIVDDVLVAIGGSDGSTRFSVVQLLDLSSPQRTWVTASPLAVATSLSAVTVLNGLVYVMGGSTPFSSYVTTVSIYNISTDTWTAGPNLYYSEATHAAAVLDGTIYALGGSCSYSVQVLAPAATRWTTTTRMLNYHGNFGAATLGTYIYAIAGRTCSSITAQVEQFDPISKTWTYVASLNTARSSFATAVVNGAIFVAGGLDSAGLPLSTVEVYNAITDVWSFAGSLPSPISRISSVVFDQGCTADRLQPIGLSVTLLSNGSDITAANLSASWALPSAAILCRVQPVFNVVVASPSGVLLNATLWPKDVTVDANYTVRLKQPIELKGAFSSDAEYTISVSSVLQGAMSTPVSFFCRSL